MKTAISIPDKVFGAAERLAHRMGLSRSQLYVTALKIYIEKHRNDKVKEKLDQIYAQIDSSLDPAFQALQSKSVGNKAW